MKPDAATANGDEARRARLTISVDEAADALGIGRNAAYAAVKAGAIPSVRFGRSIRVPWAALQRKLEQAGE